MPTKRVTRRYPTLLIGAALACAAAVSMLFLARPLLWAQDTPPPPPDLIGRWELEAQGYAYQDVNDRAAQPEWQALPAGLLFLEITHQNGRAFAGRQSCSPADCHDPFTGVIGEDGEIRIISAATSGRTIVHGKLSTQDETLVIIGVSTGWENQAISSKPSIGVLTFSARKLR